MAWPFGIPLGGVDPQAYLRLLLRLLPDGYSQDPDGPRVTELEAYATALWIGRTALDRAATQAFAFQATQLIEEWELAYGLPNDAARGLVERQARLLAAERSLAGASPGRIANALSTVAPLANVRANTRAEIEAAAADPWMIFHTGLQLDASEWQSPATRRAAARVLRRMLPARLHRVPDYRASDSDARSTPNPDEQLFVTEGATWGGAQLLGQTVLQRQDANARAVRAPATRLREYAGLVKLTAADLNTLQDLALWRPLTGPGVSNEFTSCGMDSAHVHVSEFCDGGLETVLDDSIDWRGRFILIAIRYSADDDIRPGQPDDDSLSFTRFASVLSSTEIGGAVIEVMGEPVLTGAYATVDTDLAIYARSSDGALVCFNGTDGDVAIVGSVLASPDLAIVGGATAADQVYTFRDGEPLAPLDQARWSAILAATLARPSSMVGASWASYPGAGGLHRVAVLGGMEEETDYVLDTSADWRDRLLTTVSLLMSPAISSEPFEGPIVPGLPGDDTTHPGFISTNEAWGAGYTGEGVADGTVTSGYSWTVATSVRLFARSSDGALCVRRSDTFGSEPISVMLVVLASEQTGLRSTPDASPSLAVTDDTQIEPHILNGWQDRALLGQVGESASQPVDAFPLGSKLDAFGLPERWTIRRAVDAGPVRQPVAGHLWRFVHASCAAASEVVLDSEHDWRDRIVAVALRHNTTDNVMFNSGSAVNRARYMGPGESGAMSDFFSYNIFITGTPLSASLAIRARASDGALVLRNQTGSTQYVAGIIFGSFQLGPRSA